MNFSPMRALEIITGHVIYNPAYNYKFQLKTTIDGSGTLNKEELFKMFANLGKGRPLSEFRVEVWAAMLDKDGDGKINFEEFIQLAIIGYFFSF